MQIFGVKIRQRCTSTQNIIFPITRIQITVIMLLQSVITDLKVILHRKYEDYDIKSRVVMDKVVFSKKNILFYSKLDLTGG